jgi:hypothetical protein
VSAQLDDFKSLVFHGNSNKTVTSSQDKGHRAAMETFFRAIESGQPFPIPWDQLLENTQATIQLNQELWGWPAS